MSTYSIKDLERLTNVKAHTIRIWEKRYEIVDPCRSESNIRSYTDEDLKRLLNISILNRHGIKISKIANMSNLELNKKIMEVISSDSDYLSQIESLVVAMIELNEDGFEQILNHNIQKIGFEDTLYQVIYPFFEKIGVLWQTNTINPAQEHFISNLIRMKLIVAIDSLPRTTDENAKKIILFLPEWELHEIGLLAYFYIARKHGFKVIYLGQNVPLCDMVSVSEIVLPDILATYFVSAISLNEIKSYVNQLVKHFPNQELLFSGIQAANINFPLPSNAHLVSSALEFKKNILSFKAQNP